MLKPKSGQFNVKMQIEHGNLRHRAKIRRRQDAWKVGKMAARYGARCNLWSAFVRLWPDSRRTCGESLDFDSGSRTPKKKQPPDFLFIESDHYREQLRQVIQACGLRPLDNAFTRCLECNIVLQPRSKSVCGKNCSALCLRDTGKFLPAVRNAAAIYWPATHHQSMLEELKNLESG